METADLIMAALLNPLTIGAAAIATSWLTRWLVGGRLTRRWKHVAAMMPGLPARKHIDGEAGARFDHAVSSLLPKAIRHIEQGPRGVHASALAAATGAPPEVAAATLDAIADRADHVLRVTRGGKLLYDFDTESMRDARDLLRRPVFGRVAGLVVLVLANVGTAWPMIATLGVAGVCVFFGMGPDIVWWLITALVVMAMLAGLTLLLSKWVGWLAAPSDQPQFSGPVGGGELDEGPSAARQALSWVEGKVGKSEGSSVGGDILEGVFGLVREIRDVRAVLVVAVVITFVVAVGSVFATLISWLLGLWRSLGDRRLALADISPGRWVRAGKRPSGISSIAPTTDVAGRAARALGVALTGTRPGDDQLQGRVHNAAAANDGRVSALDIALSEGLPIEEAISVGTRVCVEAGGQLEVSELGDVMFVFSATPMQDTPASAHNEIIDAHAGDEDEVGGIPVNLVGLTDQHLVAIDRLAGGSLLMVFTAPILLGGLEAELGVPGAWLVGPALLLLPVSMAAVSLAAAARTAATHAARLGALRDVRRAATRMALRRAAEGDGRLKALDVLRDVLPALRRMWPEVPRELLEDEVVRALEQVDVPMDLDASADAGGRPVFVLQPLRDRFDALRRVIPSTTPDAADDEVVFSTETS